MLLSTVAMATEESSWKLVTSCHVAKVVQDGGIKCVLIDSRSFLEHNTHHISQSVNVCCSKLVKRRLQQNKVTVQELLSKCHVIMSRSHDIIVYDQCTSRPDNLPTDCFLAVLLRKLTRAYGGVQLLKGGFLDFHANYPSLCESKTTCCAPSAEGGYKYPALTSLSQPCLPVSNIGPTKILPFLYLGSQHDALTEETIKKNDITYVLNVSTTCPRPVYIVEEHFLRIPVNDNHCAKLQPHFADAFTFIDKVKEANGRVLVHCLAGISRSPTLAIAYIMHHIGLSTDEAYKYVKEKRPTISPNFNFMGQLLAYENQAKLIKSKSPDSPSPDETTVKKQCMDETHILPRPVRSFKPFVFCNVTAATAGAEGKNVQSPTTALSKLSFSHQPLALPPPVVDADEPLPLFPGTSLDDVITLPCFTRESHKRPLSLSSHELRDPLPPPPPPLRAKRATTAASRPKSIVVAAIDTGSSSVAAATIGGSLEQCRKSRSLEDILDAADDECRQALEHCRHRQSNSSISSSSGSIHGSLEIIQVS